MSIKLEFYDIIILIKTIKKKYPGGWNQCLKDHDGDIGGRVWYDEHLPLHNHSPFQRYNSRFVRPF
jgi:hypothetical protein